MLPTSINALVGECRILPLEDNRTRRGVCRPDHMEILVDTTHPISWQAQTLIHEMTHLSCALTRGFSNTGDEREEEFCLIMGRLLSKVLLDNPGLLDMDASIKRVDVIGEVWKVEYRDEPSEDEEGISAWLHGRTQTMRLRKDNHFQIQRMRLFQLVCEAVLYAGGVEEFSDSYYWQNSAMLYSLMRLNPQAHPRAVIFGA